MSDTYQHGPGCIVSPQSPGERKKPHLIQMPPRTFSHRSSSHVITLTRIWELISELCIVPRLYSQRMAFILIWAFRSGRGGGIRTHSPKGTGFTVRRRSPTRPPPEIYNALSKYMSNLSFDYLPVCVRPGWNPDRLDTSRRIVKTFAVQAPQTGGSIRHARTFAIALFNKKVIYTQ